jgi:hypothetical protein
MARLKRIDARLWIGLGLGLGFACALAAIEMATPAPAPRTPVYAEGARTVAEEAPTLTDACARRVGCLLR